ncbi:DUF1573 domain-containing protein [Bacteroidota bacterium]
MKRLIILVNILFLTTISLSAQTGTEAANNNAPKIDFEKVVHDYGTLYQNGDGNCVFKFTNTGKEPLILTTVRSSCGCTVPKWPKEPILPGQSGVIKVKYDTRRLGVIHKQITVRSNATNATVQLSIRGTILATPVEVVPQKQIDDNSSPTVK